jgi:hypothetical protein
MKKYLVSCAAALLSLAASAQTTLTLQPDAATGKDAELFSCIPCGYSNQNFGNIAENCAIAWTKNGADHKIRSLIQFDLSSIPAGATVISATLSLSWAPGSDEGNHFGIFGSNKAWLQRVTSSWQENTVTWNNQPTTTTTNRVAVAGSTSGTQNYPNINVRILVQDMVNDPAHSFGFMLRLQTETVYKKLVFASSDHWNPALRPKLVVVYTSHALQQNPLPDARMTAATQILKVYPNPAKESVTISINSTSEDQAYVSIYDLGGREMVDQVYQLKEGRNQLSFETAAWTRGLYMVIVKTGGEMITEKLLLE